MQYTHKGLGRLYKHRSIGEEMNSMSLMYRPAHAGYPSPASAGKPKTRGRNFTAIERLYIFEAIKRDMPLEEMNENLSKDMQKLGLESRPVPVGTYEMIKNGYLKRMDESAIWNHVHNPKRLGDL